MRLPALPAAAIEHIGELASYSSWLSSAIPSARSAPKFTFREDLWIRILLELSRQPRLLTVFEFGVAWGYTTDFWLNHIDKRYLDKWHGFDSFEGLPTDWTRGTLKWHKAGTFSTGGKAPDIAHSGLVWHPGLVEDTLPQLNLDRESSSRWIVFFDLDLLEPTRFVLQHLEAHFLPGDILIFDEAYDSHNERKVIAQDLLPEHSVRCLGISPTALALEID